MKKSKKFLLSVASSALATVMVMGNSGVVALAESATPENVVSSYSQVKGINFSTVEFGDSIDVPANSGYTVNVVKPDGSSVSGAVGEGLTVSTDMVGHYTVIISNADNVKYTYDVLCTSSREYKFEIEDDKIPSFLAVGALNASNAKYSIADLPKAKVYYEEDGEKVYVMEGANKYEVAPTILGAVDSDIAAKSATVYVSYLYNKGTGVHIDKQYKIIVQDGFTDKIGPSLSVASYSESATLNAKYTLPIATATDAYDERVKVEIKVTDPDEQEVLKAEVDEKTGYATGVESAKVEFDNLDNMSFYPTKLGVYKISYVATDDNNNQSNKVEYILTVKDQKGPTINVDRTSIPESWAYDKVYYVENDEEVLKEDLNIYLPIPEYYDNSDNALTVSLTIKDPQGKEVAKVTKIENLKAETKTAPEIGKSSTLDNKDYVKEDLEKENVAVKFDVKGYVEAIKEKIGSGDITSDYKYAGVYTVQYTVQDTKTYSTTSSSTYSINISETYNDDAEVGITPSAEIAKNVVLAVGDTFKLPTFTISSSSDGYLSKEYKVKTNANAMDYVKFAGGEELTLVEENGKYYLTYEGSKLEVVSGDKLTYDISATADSGRKAAYNEKSTELIIAESDDSKTYEVIANADLSEITIDLNGEDNRFVGVEMGVKSEDGEYVSFDATVYYNKYLDKKVIKDIKFVNPNEDGTYYLEVKVYDIYGTSQVNVYKFELKASIAEDNRESEESAFATSTTVGKAITWKYTTIQTGSTFKGDVDSIATAHKVSGGKFAWMGNEFTPLQENTYTLTDTVVPLDNAGAIVTSYNEIIKTKYEMKSSVVASESTSKTIVLNKAMPSYIATPESGKLADIDVEKEIPSAVIYDAKKNYDYDIKITNPNGNPTTYKSDKKDKTNPKTSYQKMIDEYEFTADGKYTIAYMVNGATVKSYSVNVGDVTPVTFKVENFADSSDVVITKTAGYTFNFEKILLSDDDDANVSKLTFIKSIRNAKGELVGKEYEKTGTTGRDEKGNAVTLSDTGEYTVTYTVRDQSGNESHKKIIIKIVSKTEAEDFDYTTLSTIIILVVVLGIVGIIAYYIIDSRKKNKKKNK